MSKSKTKILTAFFATTVLSANAFASAMVTQPLEVAPLNSEYQMVPLSSVTKDSTTLCALDAQMKDYKVQTTQSYFDAINLWLKSNGWENVAWNLPKAAVDALHEHPKAAFNYNGCVSTAISLLAQDLDIKMNVVFDKDSNMAGVHQWENDDVQLHLVKNQDLKSEIQDLTNSYGWNWSNNDNDASWLATNNYRISSEYPIVTLKGDISAALDKVLNKYPVSARLLSSTHKVFVVDEK